ncbi:hypothetical protein AMK68_02970 [candidate division KD3-62 bacterium DG_56]|uniref:Glycoside hydrolase family 42 N-terminal domain-containing protein n=1 Tax=candidate division KD3-62 bacterium DG_56 TaxID=1704032 RepID=A0A0S7XMY5_9BACT|nr:MAG: hypothetical protein AMK68_02970 [candidate division KD3-62 bacterium DG_56]
MMLAWQRLEGLILLAALMALATTVSPARVRDRRLYVNTCWSGLPSFQTTEKFDQYLAVSTGHGFNALSIDIPWTIQKPDGSYDFSRSDERIDQIVRAGLPAFVRLKTMFAWGERTPWAKDEHLACLAGGEIYYRDERKAAVPSISHPAVRREMVKFYRAVAQHYAQRYPDRLPIVAYSAAWSLTAESEYMHDADIDYSPAAQKDFRQWLRRRGETLATLSQRWGKPLNSWQQVTLEAAHRTDFYRFGEYTLRRSFHELKQALRAGDSRAAFGVQFGCIWDNPNRRVSHATDVSQDADWIFIADAPLYPHRFSTDFLRGLCRGRYGSNEMDGPGAHGASNEVYLQQGTQMWEHGADAVFLCNWLLNPLEDPKYTFLSRLGELAKQPPTAPQPKRAIYLSSWDIYNGEGVGVYREAYDEIADRGKGPVDVINDAVILEGPAYLARYSEGIVLPHNRHLSPEVRAVIEKITVPVTVLNPQIAGTRDDYGRETDPLRVPRTGG